MRILFALPYGPTMTRVRSRMLLEQLSRWHEVTVLGLAWNAEDRAALAKLVGAGIEVQVIEHRQLDRLRTLAGDPRRPLQQIVSTSLPYARAARQLIAEARERGRPFDAVHVEHFRGASAINLFAGLDARVVYDAVDCLAALATMTAEAGPNRLVRQIARYEASRTKVAEDRLLTMADAITVVAERDQREMARQANCSPIYVIPNGVQRRADRRQLTIEPRMIFSGKLSYHANQAAVRWFLKQTWPQILTGRPDAQLVLAGADPPAWMRQLHAPGVELISNPPDLLSLIEGARVAIAPMTYGVGIQNKVLEAMACGVPVVGTRVAGDGLLSERPIGFLLADDEAAFAAAVLQLLNDDHVALKLGRQGQGYVRSTHSWESAAHQFEDLYAARPAATKAA